MAFHGKLLVDVDGEKVSLARLATDNNVSYHAILYRYKQGIRDVRTLLYGAPCGLPRPVQQREIDWLVETRWARQGQADEWKIACDLIGVPRGRWREIKLLVEEAMECTGS